MHFYVKLVSKQTCVSYITAWFLVHSESDIAEKWLAVQWVCQLWTQ